MNRIHALLSLAVVFSILLGACGSPGDSGNQPAPTADTQSAAPGGTASEPAVLDSDEDDGFTAQVTSAISVELSWEPVAGATGYQIEGSIANLAFFPIATVPSDVASYEVFPVPDEAQLNFRLTAIGGQSERSVSVQTPTEIPNPYVVEVTLEETQAGIAGFDPSTFDPATFDPGTLDPALFDPENLDLGNLVPQPATVTQEIGPAGGSIEVTSADGTQYRLTIPEGALPYELEISITPIAALGGLPQDVELIAAVQIEPDGFPLDAPAVLTITSPADLAGSDSLPLVGIGFGSGGTDFHFTPLTSEGIAAAAKGRVAITILRPTAIGPGGLSSSMLQSQGVAKASPEAVRRTTRNNPPADRSRSSRQRGAASDASRNPGGDDLAPLVPPFESWLAENIENRAKENQGAEGTYRDLFEALQDFEILLENWGDDIPNEWKDRIWDALVQAIYKRLKEAAEASCLTDAHMYGIQLAERLEKPAGAFNRELLKRFTAKYGSEGSELIRKAMQLAERCPLFLLVESDITHYDMEVYPIEHAKITADIQLRWRYEGSKREPYLIGKGEIRYGGKDIKMDKEGCLAEPNRVDGSWFHVQRLAPTFNSDGTLDNFELTRYNATGKASDIIVIFAPEDSACVEGAQGNKGRGGDFWWTFYGGYMMVNGGFPIRDWIVRAEAGMSTIADKTIIHDGGTIVLGTMTGETKFILVNKRP